MNGLQESNRTAAADREAALARAAASLQAGFDSAGDDGNAQRAEQLSAKLESGLLTVAFCGHFSAGKSTLVNALCGKQLLPSSPIPTSANVVSIRSGEPARAIIRALADGKETTFEADPLRLDDYCKNGEEFISVDIVYPIPRLGSSTVLLDTPGIDSTDDAHRMATESALHLADAVFYVMDYNHVQSEINFEFAKGLKDWGKPLYLIVNQIDKHREEELPFEEYRNSVEEAFRSWHLEPAGILYLSLREPEHPGSEFASLEGLLKELAEEREELSQWSVDASLRHLVRASLRSAAEEEEALRQKLQDEAGSEEERAVLAERIASLEAEAEEADNRPAALEASLKADIVKLLDNASLTPAATRDLAAEFLDSRKPGFKTGLLFAGAKTAAEQQRRAEAFRDDLNRQIQAAAVWHLGDLLRKAADEAGLAGTEREAWEHALEEGLSWRPDIDWLAGRVNTGAVFGGEYTLVYTREAAAEIKGRLRRAAVEAAEALAACAAPAAAAAAAEARARLAALGARAGALAQLAALDAAAGERAARLAAQLPPAPQRPALPAPRRAAAAAQAAAAVPAAQPAAGAAPAQPAERVDAAPAGAAAGALAPQRAAAERLRAAAALLAPHPALAGAADAMLARAARLGASRFTIALFGAFSAGKSSLANALIGERALPVSPNPTTAAINRILAPTPEQPHGTARVSMKSRDDLLDDLRYSLSLLGEDASAAGEEELLRRMGALQPDGVHAAGRPHYSFLKAALAGWPELSPLLGQELRVGEEEYRRYVAEESRSCFVREIELYYSSPLTDQGIVLVDTPGADSVNARHTGVAFNYIKNADAILFVTYYNHAFSQADRQFLMQLGRVKDQFELDKMFFLVNAADLASSEGELKDVLGHVESNLLQHGIRFPRLYPVSSLLGLQGKQSGDNEKLEQSGLPAFERSFLSFTRDELGSLAVQAADMEISRSVSVIDSWLAAAEGDAGSRAAELRRLQELAAEARQLPNEARENVPAAELDKELQELFYYIQQRIQYGFGEFYQYAFNPASLQDDGRDLRRAVWTSWLELQRMLQMELSQELLATTLRLESAGNALIRKRYEESAAKLKDRLPGFMPEPFESIAFPSPPEPSPWKCDSVEAKWLYGMFRNPRSFFEGEGKKKLRDELEAKLGASIREWMDAAGQDWKAAYASRLATGLEEVMSALSEAFIRYSDGTRLSLQDNSGLESLREMRGGLDRLQAAI